MYNLMKSLYCNPTCSIKIDENKTQSFSYSRGVRQGCFLSPRLFNLCICQIYSKTRDLTHLFFQMGYTFVRRWFSYSMKIENRITELFKFAVLELWQMQAKN